MSRIIIYLGLPSPAASSDLPESRPGKPVALCLVLLRMGFTCAPSVTRRAVVSYTAFPPLPGIPRREALSADVGAVYFYCTGLGVTSTGRYPASCPAKPGLSSSAAFRRMQPRLSVLLNTVLHYTMSDSECQTPVLLSESLGFCFYILLYTVREKACQTLHRIPRNASGTHFSCLYDA